MKLFSEQVSHTFTNSSHNILQVENYDEIFFDVFEIEINKSKYPVEKISSYNGNPVVSVPVVSEGVEVFYPFILTKGKFEIIFNENNTFENCAESLQLNIEGGEYTVIRNVLTENTDTIPEQFQDNDVEHFNDTVNELKEQIVEISEKKQAILNQIEEAKKEAKRKIDDYRKRSLKESSEQIKSKNKLLKQTLDTARDSLVSEFVDISSKIKSELFDVSSEQYSELKETLDNKITVLSDELKESLNYNLDQFSNIFDSKVKDLIKELYKSSVIPKVETELNNIAKQIVEKVDTIESTLDDKLNEVQTNIDTKLKEKAEMSIVENVTKQLEAIQDANIELNNNINKGVNKALSRAGNVKILVEKLTEDVNKKIENTEESITAFYNEKINLLREQHLDLADEARDYYISLISENKESILKEIAKLKTEAPVEYIIESEGLPTKKDFKSIEKDWDTKIKALFENYKVDLRKYVAVYASGGGTNATQYQDGGIMNGNLTVVGAISASQYLGIPTGGDDVAVSTKVRASSANWDNTYTTVLVSSANWDNTYTTVQSNSASWGSGGVSGAYLPLTGGTLTGGLSVQGNVIITGSLSASQFLGLPIGDDVAVSTKVRASSANWDNSYITVNGLSSNWNNSYITVNGLSSNWNNTYTAYSSSSASYVTTDFANSKYLALSGGTLTGNLSTTGNISPNAIILNDTPTIGAYDEGKIYYDSVERTASIEIGNNITLGLARDITTRVYNNTGVTLSAGVAVKISTTAGGRIDASLAIASGIPNLAFTSTSGVVTVTLNNHGYPNNTVVNVSKTSNATALRNGFYAISNVTTNTFDIAYGSGSASGTCTVSFPNQVAGIVIKPILTGSYGLIQSAGIVKNINTSTLNVGDIIYLSDTTLGAYVSGTANLDYASRSNKIGYVVTKDASVGQIYVNIENENVNQSLTIIQRNILEGNTISTGVYEFSGITANGADPTHKVDIPSIKGWIINNTGTYFSTSPSVTNVVYAGATNVTVQYLNTADSSYFLLDSSSNLYQQNTYPTPEQRRDNIYLGKVAHPNRSTILAINNTVDYDTSPMSALRDMFSSIPLINDGVVCYPDGANLSFNTTRGSVYGMGINWANNQKSPNTVIIDAKLPASFYYRTQLGGTSGIVSLIDPTRYDNAGTVTTIPGGGNTSTNQRVYLYATGILNIQYGQQTYSSLANAVAAQHEETFIKSPNAIGSAVLIGIIAVRKGATNLGLANDAKFTPVSIFGEATGGTSGISTTSLQQAYDNSSAPEIITDSTLGALSLKRGSAADTDNVFEVLNGAGSVNTAIQGNGNITTLGSVSASNLVYRDGNTNGANLTVGTNDNYNLNLETAGVGRMTILSGGNVGIGTTTPTQKLDVNGNINSSGNMTLSVTLTGSQFSNSIDLLPTWNTTGNPSLIYGRITNTASGLSSNLIDLGTVSGGSLFKITKAGTVDIRDTTVGSYTIPSLGFNGYNTGFTAIAGYGMSMMAGGTQFIQADNRGGSNPLVAIQGVVGLPSVSVGGTSNIQSGATITSDSAHILAQRNNLNSQEFRLYNTYTSATSAERATFKFVNNDFVIGTETLPLSGPQRSMLFQTASATRMSILSSGNVGIGTSAPTEVLTVSANIAADAGLANFIVNGSSGLLVKRRSDSGGPQVLINNSLSFIGQTLSHTGTSNQINFNNNGISISVGGTNQSIVLSPNGTGSVEQRNGLNSQTFNLYNTYTSATSAERATFKFVNNDFVIGAESLPLSSPQRSMLFQTASATRMTILSSGNVGIGTPTPSQKLDVNGTIATGGLSITGDSAYGTSTTFTYTGNAAATHRTALGVAKSVEIFDFTRASAPPGATGGAGVWSWTAPTGAKVLKMTCIAGGGGGGSGRRGSALSVRYGGGGGAGGGMSIYEMPAPATTITVNVGIGGAGASGQTVDSTDGIAGTSGGSSSVSWTGFALNAIGASRGSGGTTAAGSGGGVGAFGGMAMFHGEGGANGNSTNGFNSQTQNVATFGARGGGGGGGVDAVNTQGTGGTAGAGPSTASVWVALGTTAGGAAGGGNGASGASSAIIGNGGGGGGGNATGAGGSGGNAGTYGGGGGGGGASVNGFNSGAGGNGGDGFVRIIVFY